MLLPACPVVAANGGGKSPLIVGLLAGHPCGLSHVSKASVCLG